MAKHRRSPMFEDPFCGGTRPNAHGEACEAWTNSLDRRSIIIVCKDERDWTDPEAGEPYAGFDMGDINMITMKNLIKLKNIVFVLDDMGDKYNSHIK